MTSLERPTLGVCYMVRDEAELLDRSISSLTGFPRELYVTDTGSLDATLDVARSHCAAIHHYSWTGRFDEARNASIAPAREDWLLIIDADDVFPPGEFARLGGILNEAASHATLLYHFDSEQLPIRAPRLLRRSLRPFFLGGIHENLSPWLASLPESLREPFHSEVNLYHRPDAGSQPEKLARNLPLLFREWENMPAGAYSLRRFFLAAELAMTLHFSGESGAARKLSGTELDQSEGGGAERLRLIYVHLWLLWQAGDYTSSRETTLREHTVLSSSVIGQLLLGLDACNGGRHREAADRLMEFNRRLDRSPPEFPLPLAHTGTSLLRLIGSMLIMAGDPRAAHETFLEAMLREPENPENRLRAKIANSTLLHDS